MLNGNDERERAAQLRSRSGIRTLFPIVALLLLVAMSRHDDGRGLSGESTGDRNSGGLGDGDRGRDDKAFQSGEVNSKFPVSLNDFYKGVLFFFPFFFLSG